MFFSSNVPVDWLLDTSRRPMQSFHLLFCLLVSLVFYLHLPRPQLFVFFPCLVLTSSCGLFALKVRSRPHLAEALHTFTFVAGTVISSAAILFYNEEAVKYRSMGVNYLLWKSIPGFFGFRAVPRMIIIGASVACDVWIMALEPHMFGTPFQHERISVILVYAVLYFGIATALQNRLLILYELQQELSVESAACDSLFSMTCDSKLLVAVDGDTVLSTDGRVEQILNRRSLHGERLSLCLTECEAEHKRVRDAFERAKDNPVQLPTSFVLQSGDAIPVELLIVNRGVTRKLKSSASYSVGVRIYNSDPALGNASDAGNADDKQSAVKQGFGGFKYRSVESDALQELAVEHAHDLHSVQSTTVTGNNFRMLSAAAALHDVDAVRRYARVISDLGKREHWLLPPSDVFVQPSCILGAGSFGVVVAAHLHGTVVAVKMPIASTAVDSYWYSIVNEIHILRHVRHPNLVLFHGACLDPESLEVGLVFEFVNGVGLDRFVTGPPPSSEFRNRYQVGLDVICALRFLHAQTPPIVHSDLKPSNVMVDSSNFGIRAKLIDFGITSLVTRNAHTLGGTLQWLAPEVIRDPSGAPAPSSDVFSFGRVLHFVATGESLLAEVSRDAILDMAYLGVMMPPYWPENLEPLCEEWQPLCVDCVSNVEAERPSSMQVHAEMLCWPFCDADRPLEDEGVAFPDAVRQVRELMRSPSVAFGIEGAAQRFDAGKPKVVAVADSKPELASRLINISL